MATRGYIRIVNDENNADDEELYTRRGDVLLEASHDGYIDCMVVDMLCIPFRVARLYKYNMFHNYTALFFGKNNRFLKPEDSFAGVLDTNIHTGFFDFIWCSVISLLHMTKFEKYIEISENVTRYDHPVTFQDVSFSAELTNHPHLIRLDLTKLTNFNFFLDEEQECFFTDIREFVDKLNTFITCADLKIKLTEDSIEFSIGGIILNLLWENYKNDSEFETVLPEFQAVQALKTSKK